MSSEFCEWWETWEGAFSFVVAGWLCLRGYLVG